jgi:hypothetical protein
VPAHRGLEVVYLRTAIALREIGTFRMLSEHTETANGAIAEVQTR